MLKRIGILGILLTGGMVWAASFTAAEEITIESPQKAVRATVTVEDTISYELFFQDKAVLSGSLGLVPDGTDYGPLAAASVETRTIDTQWENRFGRSRLVKDHAAEATIFFKEKETPNREYAVVLRAYDDGFAFRYVLPGNGEDITLAGEKTTVDFGQDRECWGMDAHGFHTSFESTYTKMLFSEMPPNVAWGLPLVVRGEFGTAAVLEAALEDFPAMYLFETGKLGAFKIGYPPRSDNGKFAVGKAPFETPWRVVLLGNTPIDLVNNSGIVLNLNKPCAVEDTSWIKPGTASWTFRSVSHRDLSTELAKEQIDFAAEMEWEYTLIDESWYGISRLSYQPGDTIDLLAGGSEIFNLDEVVQYGNEKGIGVFLWVHKQDLADCGPEKAFQYFAEHGVKGLKLDFFDREDQEMVEWVNSLIALAAKYHLMLNCHGMYHPTGIYRTFPNYLTQEGIFGNEYMQVHKEITPRHCLGLPFTHYLMGVGDFTPGGFHNVHSEVFQPEPWENGRPILQMGTRAYGLAQCVLYDSPLMTLCNTPDYFRTCPEAQMLKDLPACWDESIALAGEIEEYFVMARRSGEKWYLSAMCNPAKTVEVTLDFLPAGTTWEADLYTDVPESDTNAEAIAVTHRTFKAGEKVTIEMVREGGWNAVLTPAK